MLSVSHVFPTNRQGQTWSLWLGLLVSIAFFCSGLYAKHLEKKRVNWPSVEGEIEMVMAVKDSNWSVQDLWEIVDSIIDSKRTTRNRHRDPDQKQKYVVQITYSYKVDGTSYQGKDQTSSNRMTLSSAEAEAKTHSIGDSIKVFHDPDTPSSSLLTTNAGISSILNMFIGLVGMLVSVYLIANDNSVPGEYDPSEEF